MGRVFKSPLGSMNREGAFAPRKAKGNLPSGHPLIGWGKGLSKVKGQSQDTWSGPYG